MVLAVVLFAVAAVLMFTGQGEELPAPKPEVNFPNRMQRDDWARAEKRRTYLAPVDAGVAAAEPLKKRDPVLDALPREQGKTAIVIEANAIRHSPLGQLLLECMMPGAGNDLERFKKETGVDRWRTWTGGGDGRRLHGVRPLRGLAGEETCCPRRGATGYDYGASSRIFERPRRTPCRMAGTGTRRGEPLAMGMWKTRCSSRPARRTG
jgi:hypothetical protein